MGFSTDWLTLREPADRAARDPALLERAVRLAGPHPVVMDVGCGTGSTVRTLASTLPTTRSWRLVDNDPVLLDQAQLAAGPQSSSHLVDINQLESLPLEGVTLMTASALLDLVTEDWLGRLATLLTVPFYAALSYNGQMQWDPADALDETVTEAFNDHQRRDKGLGPALGPTSVEKTRETFEAAGFTVLHAESRWQLGVESVELQQALVEGIAQAAEEAGETTARAWGDLRVAQAPQAQCTIGHGDLLIIPPTMANTAVA